MLALFFHNSKSWWNKESWLEHFCVEDMKICIGDFDEEEKGIGLRSGIDTAEFLRAQQSQNNFLPWSLVAFKGIVS